MAVKLLFFRDLDGTVPLLVWLDKVPEKALIKCLNRLERLHELGHMLRRPEADYLRDGIYGLRVKHLNVNYRMLYFFYGQAAVVVTHGLVKDDIVPVYEIERASERRRKFMSNPGRFTAEG